MPNGEAELDARDAAYLLGLAHSRRFWTARRTVRLSFDGEDTLCRSTVVEIVATAETLARIRPLHGRIPLPIANVVRTPARHVRTYSEHGELPVMLRTTERLVVALAIAPRLLPSEAHYDINLIVELVAFWLDQPLYTALDTDRTLRVNEWQVPPDLGLLMASYINTRVVFALPSREQISSHFFVTETHAEAITPRKATAQKALLVRSRRTDPTKSHFAAWRLTEAGDIRQNRILTVADGSAITIDSYREEAADTHFKKAWKIPWALPDTFIVNIGLNDVLDCESYHVELTTPAGVYADRATMRLLNDDGQEEPGSVAEMILIQNDDHHPDRVHLHFSRHVSRRAAPDDSYNSALLRIVLRPTYHGGLRAGAHVSLVTMGALWMLVATIGWVAADRGCQKLCLPLSSSNPDALVAVLLLAPTFALVAIVRQDEHDLTKLVQQGYRARLYGVGVVLFVVGLVLAIGVTGEHLLWILRVCAGITSILTVFTAISAWYSRHRIRMRLKL